MRMARTGKATRIGSGWATGSTLAATAGALVMAAGVLGLWPRATEADFDPKAVAILQECSQGLVAARSFRAQFTWKAGTAAPGFKMEMTAGYILTFQRPNQVAMAMTTAMERAAFVCDGNTMHSLRGEVYSRQDGVEYLADIGADMLPVDAFRECAFVLTTLCAEDPYAVVTRRAAAVRYVGIETVQGQPCHHIRVSMSGPEDPPVRDAWLTTDHPPRLVRVYGALAPPPTTTQPGGERAGEFGGGISFDFQRWEVNPNLEKEAFDFTPPPGARRVDFPQLDMDDLGPPHPMVGKPAGDLELEMLDGRKVRLGEHEGKHVVVLHFWKTSDGRVVRILDKIAATVGPFRDRGVVWYAVNELEDPSAIHAFLERQRLDIPVALDRQGHIAHPFDIMSTPQTLILDARGTVQSTLHTGSMYLPRGKARFRKDLEAVVAGRDLAGETLRAFYPPMELAGMKVGWELEGPFYGVAVDAATGAIYAASEPASELVQINAGGSIQRRFRVSDYAEAIRTAHLKDARSCELITFSKGERTVKAHDLNGQLLWSHESRERPDDVCAADLNGDGLDEVVIGYKEWGGLYVLDPCGKLLWKDESITHIRSVAAGSIAGHEGKAVVAVSGGLHLYDGDGSHRLDIDPGFKVDMARITPQGQIVAREMIGGLAALDAKNRRQWSLNPYREGDGLIESACVSRSGWVALAMEGKVLVVDAAQGKVVASATCGRWFTPREMAWLEGADVASPLLLVSDWNALHAFRIEAAQTQPSPTPTSAGSVP